MAEQTPSPDFLNDLIDGRLQASPYAGDVASLAAIARSCGALRLAGPAPAARARIRASFWSRVESGHGRLSFAHLLPHGLKERMAAGVLLASLAGGGASYAAGYSPTAALEGPASFVRSLVLNLTPGDMTVPEPGFLTGSGDPPDGEPNLDGRGEPSNGPPPPGEESPPNAGIPADSAVTPVPSRSPTAAPSASPSPTGASTPSPGPATTPAVSATPIATLDAGAAPRDVSEPGGPPTPTPTPAVTPSPAPGASPSATPAATPTVEDETEDDGEEDQPEGEHTGEGQ